jgi:hypothetical protein
MWPELFGPGSDAGLFVAAVIMVVVGITMSFAMRQPRPSDTDPMRNKRASQHR